MERQHASSRHLTETDVIEAMTPGIKYTCTALARKLRHPAPHVHTLLSHLVQSGMLRRMRGRRSSIYWHAIREEAKGLEDDAHVQTLPMTETEECDDRELRPHASPRTLFHES
ncbi:hypothetical protein [Paraburkholderia diazotrophica]|uniref:hypothetical protein n=1 Tax=Paraburkholderia diazotrophica TaxID=667676 RepID=UPI0031743749